MLLNVRSHHSGSSTRCKSLNLAGKILRWQPDQGVCAVGQKQWRRLRLSGCRAKKIISSSVATGHWRRGTFWSHPTQKEAKSAVIAGSDATGIAHHCISFSHRGDAFVWKNIPIPPPALAPRSSVVSRSCQHLHGSLDRLSSCFIPQLLIPGLRPRQMAAADGARRRRCKSAPPPPLTCASLFQTGSLWQERRADLGPPSGLRASPVGSDERCPPCHRHFTPPPNRWV